MMDDTTLIRRYLDGSQEAFAELVRGHIGAVYGTALRLVAGDAHLADDVTQKVFTDLARKASALVDRPVIVGWLYLSCQYEAAKAVRAEQRRRAREQKAHAMKEIYEQGSPEPEWTALRPVLDTAMRELKDDDRNALLLRFFQARTLAEVGIALGLSENAARMRVDRALDKLHGLLACRGITSTAAALGAVLAGQAATAAPATLAASVTSVALAGAASGAGATLLFMGMTKLQIGVATALAVAGGSTLWSQRQTESRLQAENSALVQQTAEVSQLKMENARLELDRQKADQLRVEASMVNALRAEEAQLREATVECAKMASTDCAKAQKTSDGKPLYAVQQLDQIPQARKRTQPVYPFDLKKIGVGGEVLVEFTVGPDGAVKDLKVVKSTHEAFAAAAAEALAKWKFKPGEKDGVPVNTRLQQPLVFAVANDETANWF